MTEHEGRQAGHEVLERVRAILPALRERAPLAEQLRRLPDESAKELKATGMVRLLQPARYGGYEADPRIFYEAGLAVAAACGSTGWVSTVVGVHPWQLALWADEAQREVWGDDPDTWVSSSYMPGGVLTPVEGGYRLSGRWSFSSGCDHCAWVILGTSVDHGPDAPPDGRNAIVPRSDYLIEDVWQTVGLRGTGSNDVVIEDAFVPEHRTLRMEDMFATRSPGLAVNTGPLYQLPFAGVFANAITGPIIGMAEAMVAEALAFTHTRVSKNWGRALDDPYFVATLGESAREVDACRLQLMRNIGDMYETAARGAPVTMEQRTRTRRDQVLGTERAVAALDRVYDRCGAGAIMLSNPMQRIWRDAHAAKHHTVNTLERSLFSYAHNAMGLGPTELMV